MSASGLGSRQKWDWVGAGYSLALMERGLAKQLQVEDPEAKGKGFESCSTDTSMAINEKGRSSVERKATGDPLKSSGALGLQLATPAASTDSRLWTGRVRRPSRQGCESWD